MKILIKNLAWVDFYSGGEPIGVEYRYEKDIYEVTDKQLFMLAVIKYGIEFKEVKY
jgi:hypothetical protein